MQRPPGAGKGGDEVKRAFLRRVAAVLPWIPVLFSTFFLFCFTPPYRASLLLLALVCHEGGHLFAFAAVSAGSPRLCPVAGGFRFLSPAALSYRGELSVALAGPIANLLPGLLLLPLGTVSPYFTEAGWTFICTGLSNLIPIADHDGGRALLCLLSTRTGGARAARIAALVSLLSLSVSLTVSFSLLYVFGAGFYFTVFCLFSLLSHPLPGDNFF